MKRVDQGVSAVGLLLLFVVLTVLLGVGLPVIKSEAPLKASDWLGFAGNMIAAVFAALAAVVAWVAAQRQIKHASLQNSVIAYGTLKEVLASIRADANANSQISISLEMFEYYSREPIIQFPSGERPRWVEAVDEYVEKLTESLDELRRTTANPWGNVKTRELRSNLIQALSISLGLANIQMALNIGEDGEQSPENAAQSHVSETWGETLRLSKEFQIALEGELKRIYRLIDEHFSNFTQSD